MADLRSPSLIWLKGVLFLLGALIAAAGLVLDNPTLRTAFLTGVLIWCSARFYYFAFYVLERYVDPAYRFAGVWSLAKHALRARRTRAGSPSTLPPCPPRQTSPSAPPSPPTSP